MKPPHTLSDAHLLEYADTHVTYELNMLVWTSGLLSALFPFKTNGYLPWTVNNATVNSYSMHARNLIDFLYSRSLGKDYSTDIILQDYIGQAASSKFPPIPPLLEAAKTKADKQVAHLTRERIDYEKAGKEWHFVDIALAIAGAFKAVAPFFPPARSSQAFRDLISFPKLRIPLIDARVIYSESEDPLGLSVTLGQASSAAADSEGISA